MGDRRLGHPQVLRQVLLNLTTNALKYTSRGHVVVAARAEGPAHVAFSVSDTGGGLDAAALRKLYEPRRDFSSAGLGLPICRKLLQATGASLRVETWPGKGTRFSFELHLPRAGRASTPAILTS
jgi:signal transduction histidine kinase